MPFTVAGVAAPAAATAVPAAAASMPATAAPAQGGIASATPPEADEDVDDIDEAYLCVHLPADATKEDAVEGFCNHDSSCMALTPSSCVNVRC